MGAHCCKFICKPCASRKTVKVKVKELFQPYPGQPEEHHAKIKTDKLIDYLKDRKQELKLCANEFSIILIHSVPTILTPLEVSKYKIALCSLKILVGSFKEYFLLMSYKLSFELISHQDFYKFQDFIYDLICESCSLYPEEKPPALQEITTVILRSALNHTAQITDKELKFITLLVKNLKFELIQGQRKEQELSWQTVLSIALIRIIQGYANSTSYEMRLVSILSEFLCTNYQLTQEFLNFIIKTLGSKQAWNDKSCEIFEAIDSEMLMTMIYYIHSVVSVLDTQSLQYIIDCTNIICKNSTGTMPTLIYNQTLKEVLKEISNRGDLNDKSSEFLDLWTHRTDAQSYFNLYKIFIEEEETHEPYFYILKMFKHKLRSEFKHEPNQHWIYGSLELIKDLAVSIHSNFSRSKLSFLADLVKLLTQKVKLKNSEIILISRSLTNALMNMRSELDSETIELYKDCMYIWISIILQGHKDSFRLIYSILVKLRVIYIQDITIHTRNTQHFYCRFLLYLLCIKTTAMIYQHVSLMNYVNNELSKYIQEPYRTYIVNEKKFLSYINFENKLFVREDLDLLKRYTQKVPSDLLYFEKHADIYSEIQPLDLQAIAIEDWDPLRYAPSENSSYSSPALTERDESLGDVNDIKLEFSAKEYPKNISQAEDLDRAVLNSVTNKYDYN